MVFRMLLFSYTYRLLFFIDKFPTIRDKDYPCYQNMMVIDSYLRVTSILDAILLRYDLIMPLVGDVCYVL
jgi:hypothetical protein